MRLSLCFLTDQAKNFGFQKCSLTFIYLIASIPISLYFTTIISELSLFSSSDHCYCSFSFCSFSFPSPSWAIGLVGLPPPCHRHRSRDKNCGMLRLRNIFNMHVNLILLNHFGLYIKWKPVS